MTPVAGLDFFDQTQIPDGWSLDSLGNRVVVRRGSSPRPIGDPRFLGGSIPWIKIGDVTRTGGRFVESTAECLTDEGADRSVRVPVGSLIIANSGVSLGFAAITKISGCIHDGWLLLTEFNDADPLFLYYRINSITQKLRDFADGTTQPNLNTEIARRLRFPFPPLATQQAIAATLGGLDDKIELNRRMNETLEAMARAVFRAWFVDFEPVRAKAEGRKPGGVDAATAKLFPDKFEDTPLGPVPKGWRMVEIKTLTSNIQYGLTQSASNTAVGPHFLRITDIQGGRVDWSKVPYCSVDSEDGEKYRIRRGDIFVARTGASTGENIYVDQSPDAVFASYLVRFQFADDALGRVVGEFMRTPDYFDYVAGVIGGSAQPNASAQVLAGATLVAPPLEIARLFKEFVEPWDRMRYQNDCESCTLSAIRDALLPKLLSGEVQVA